MIDPSIRNRLNIHSSEGISVLQHLVVTADGFNSGGFHRGPESYDNLIGQCSAFSKLYGFHFPDYSFDKSPASVALRQAAIREFEDNPGAYGDQNLYLLMMDLADAEEILSLGSLSLILDLLKSIKKHVYAIIRSSPGYDHQRGGLGPRLDPKSLNAIELWKEISETSLVED